MNTLVGKEAKLVDLLLNRLAAHEQKEVATLVAELEDELLPKLTEEAIEKRDYTYCTYFIANSMKHLAFLVPTTNTLAAKSMAQKYLRGEEVEYEEEYLHLYPKNYIAGARKLFKEGKYYNTY